MQNMCNVASACRSKPGNRGGGHVRQGGGGVGWSDKAEGGEPIDDRIGESGPAKVKRKRQTLSLLLSLNATRSATARVPARRSIGCGSLHGRRRRGVEHEGAAGAVSERGCESRSGSELLQQREEHLIVD